MSRSTTVRPTAVDIFETMAGDIESFWRHWEKVTDGSPTCGSRSGGWNVRKEHRDDRLGPPFHEVAVYVERGYHLREVGRWPLDDLPDDPMKSVRERIEYDND